MKILFIVLFLTSCVQTIPSQGDEQSSQQVRLQAEARRQKDLADYNREREAFAKKEKQEDADKIYNENGNRIDWTDEDRRFNQNEDSLFY